jgi:hypothetical protein
VEQSRRLREAEEAAYARSMVESKGLSHHLQSFDARTARQQIARDLQREGFGGALGAAGDGDMPAVKAAGVARVRMRAARRGVAGAAKEPYKPQKSPDKKKEPY